MFLCKYLDPTGLIGSLGDDCVCLKFALPDTYNDPFELFLGCDSDATPQEVAFFDFYLGEIPKLPVTCFSKSADSTVMWAHYARNRQGGCLVFDEAILGSYFELAGCGDVEYVDTFPTDHLTSLDYAMNTGKARHMRQTLDAAYRQAYFTKSSAWSYEHERRLVVNRIDVSDHNGMLLARVPIPALKCIIVGGSAEDATVSTCKAFANRHSVPMYTLRFSRKVNRPYFTLHSSAKIFQWTPSGMSAVGVTCVTCGEPVLDSDEEDDDCPWCKCSDDARGEAGMLNSYGLMRYLDVPYPAPALPGTDHYGRLCNEGDDVSM